MTFIDKDNLGNHGCVRWNSGSCKLKIDEFGPELSNPAVGIRSA